IGTGLQPSSGNKLKKGRRNWDHSLISSSEGKDTASWKHCTRRKDFGTSSTASAILKNNGSATLHMPPNLHLFDTAKISPVMQHHMNSCNQRDAQVPQVTVPMITPEDAVGKFAMNILSTLLQPQATQTALTDLSMNSGALPAPSQAAVDPPLTLISTTAAHATVELLGAGFLPGPNMTLDNFCTWYDVSKNVHNKLITSGFTKAQFLRYLNESDLAAMEFKFGERAELLYALEEWSKHTVTAA
ncbi:hypothetical protein FA15DRAFT_657438, partial [Coprinopsis marcescibilis]